MQSKITRSRGPSLNTDICTENIGNKFDVVLIGAARARELIAEHRKSEDKNSIHPVMTSLLEIQNGTIGREYLMKVRSK